MAKEEGCHIPYKDKKISAAYSRPDASNGYGLILTHGAGGDMSNSQLTALANYMSERGFLVLRFTCKGLNLQYRTNVYHTVLKYFQDENKTMKGCFLAGKSMGSRAGVAVANLIKDTDLASYVRGVVCLSYPLYPAGKQSQMRDEPLKLLEYPTLFLSGTKDDMAECSLLEKAVGQIPREAKIYWIGGANHAHKVAGRKTEEVNEEVFLQMAEWCNYVLSEKSARQGLNMSMMIDKLKRTCEPYTPVGSREAQATSTEYTHTDRGRDGSQKGSLPSSPLKKTTDCDMENNTDTSKGQQVSQVSPLADGKKTGAKRTAAKRSQSGEAETETPVAKKPRAGRGQKKK